MSRPRIRWGNLARLGGAGLACAGLLMLVPRLLDPAAPAIPPADVGLAGIEPPRERHAPRAVPRAKPAPVRTERRRPPRKPKPAAHHGTPAREHAATPARVPAPAPAPTGPRSPQAPMPAAPITAAPAPAPPPTPAPAPPPASSPSSAGDGHDAGGGNAPPEFGFEH